MCAISGIITKNTVHQSTVQKMVDAQTLRSPAGKSLSLMDY